MKTDQEAAEEYAEKKWIGHVLNNQFEDAKTVWKKEIDRSIQDFLAGCAHVRKAVKIDIKDIFDAARAECPKKEDNGGWYQRYKYNSFEQWLAEQEDFK